MSNLFISADAVAVELEVSKPHAYKIIRQLNAELQKQGYMTIAGKVSRKYFYEKFYGATEEVAAKED